MFNSGRIARLEAAVDDLTKRLNAICKQVKLANAVEDADRRERQVNLLSDRLKEIQAYLNGGTFLDGCSIKDQVKQYVDGIIEAERKALRQEGRRELADEIAYNER